MPDKISILVVDDDPIILHLLEAMLSANYQVILAASGEDAWEIIRQKGKELTIVLSDIQMPGLDGMGLLQRIRTEFPNLCVIMLSGNSDAHTAVKAMREGAYDYIAKPFSDLAELDIIIQRWLQYQSLEAKLEQYAKLHQEMMKSMRARTFLSLDVAGSKQMKLDEDPFLVQYSFSVFHQYVAAIVARHNGEIHSTAGDGVMACFVQSQDAINAATDMLSGLPSFNREKNRLAMPFTLRIGIHTGLVIVESGGRISDMFSEALDITGHIQKGAMSNCIALSESTAALLGEKNGITKTEQQVSNLQIYSMNVT